MAGCASRCKRFLSWEFHYSKLCFCTENWKSLAFCPLLPQNKWFQLVYLLYRVILAIYFAIEIIIIGVESGTPKFFIRLSHLSFTVFVIYLVWSAISVTAKFIEVYVICKDKYSYQQTDLESSNLQNAPTLYCGLATDELSWYQRVQWFLFTVGAEMAVASTLLYWSLVHKVNTGFTNPGVNVPINLLNAIVAILDTWLTGIPIRILHGIYLILFGAGFQLFTGIYYAANGTDINGKHSINQIPNYNTNPGVSAIIDIAIPFIILPIIHLLFFLNYLMKESLLYVIKSKCIRSRPSPKRSNLLKKSEGNPFRSTSELQEH